MVNIINKIKCICENEYEYFLNKKNVVGIALGCKFTRGFCTCKKCITVFVSRKISKNKLTSVQLIPPLYKGIKTDVIQTGCFENLSLRDRVRPIRGGYNIGSEFYSIGGTFGCLVTDGCDQYLLSNNHVIALGNTSPIGGRILQPALQYGGKIQTDVVGNLSKYVPIKFIKWYSKPLNCVDCAMAKVLDKSMVLSQIMYVGNIRGIGEATVNKNVKKVGATSELTNGIITNIDATILTNDSFVKKQALFGKQIVTTKMCSSGDSGSVLLDEDNYAIGLAMSGSESVSTFNYMSTVLEKLEVSIVTN